MFGVVILMMMMTVMMTVIIYKNRDGKTANILFIGFIARLGATIVGYLELLPLIGHEKGHINPQQRK